MAALMDEFVTIDNKVIIRHKGSDASVEILPTMPDIIGIFHKKPLFDEVILSNGLEMIGADAFNGDRSLEKVIIPPSVLTFGDRSFQDCPKLTIFGTAGSAAESFAEKNGILFCAI